MTTTDAYSMRTTQDYTLFTLRDNLDRQDRERFKSLCVVFGCYRAPDFKRFTLTPVRGQKLDRLFRAGFVGCETYFRHPAIPSRRFSTKEATNVLGLAEYLLTSWPNSGPHMAHDQDSSPANQSTARGQDQETREAGTPDAQAGSGKAA